MFPPIQCSKSSYFTQWLISEYLNRINNESTTPPGEPTTESATKNPTTEPNHPSSSSSSTSTNQNNLFSTAKHLKHLFTTHHHHASNNQNHSSQMSQVAKGTSESSSSKKSNNVYKTQQQQQLPNNNDYKLNQNVTCPKNIEFIQLLALNALEFTAPIYSFINKKHPGEDEEGSKGTQVSGEKTSNEVKKQQPNQLQNHSSSSSSSSHANNHPEGLKLYDGSNPEKTCKCPSTRSFIQLSGHPGSFAPAGPNTIWKKMPEDEVRWIDEGRVGWKVVEDEDSLKELLGKLDVRGGEGESCGGEGDACINARRASLFPTHSPTSSSSNSAQQQPPNTTTDTTPITVFFNSTTSSSSTTQQPVLLPPKIYNIPTHLLPNETQVYRKLCLTNPPDPLVKIIPKYITETCYNSQMFLELEDLLTNFNVPNPTIMDIKLGTRTFLESEVANNKPRPDLFKKLSVLVEPGSVCSAEELEARAVTKLTYMLVRERQSSSCSLGFRVEGVKIGVGGVYRPEAQVGVNFKVLQGEEEISSVFWKFCKGDERVVGRVVERLEFIRGCLEASEFFMSHEVIGSSLLFIHDDVNVGVWLIDFAKTFELGGGRLSHRGGWVMGNREDGVLTGVDNIVRLFKGLCLRGGS